MNTKTGMSYTTLGIMEYCKWRGIHVEQVSIEIQDASESYTDRLCPPGVRDMVDAIRSARRFLKDDSVCTSVKYKIAERSRGMVRAMRDIGVISFDCCTALQRALDY